MKRMARTIALLLAAVFLVQAAWAAEPQAEGQGTAHADYQTLMQQFVDPASPDGFSYPDDFGGAYLDETGKLVIQIVGTEGTLRSMVASLLPSQDYVLREVEFSLNALTAWKNAIDAALLQLDTADLSPEDRSLLSAIQTVSISQKDNCIRVGLQDLTDEKADAFRQKFGESAPFVFSDARTEVSTGSQSVNYTDVPRTAWYYDAVAAVSREGLMKGTGETTFSPDTQMTRGMLTTVLYRLDGSHPVTHTQEISDVPDDLYCAQAVHWALQNGIVTLPPDGTFRPSEAVSRLEMAELIHRYAVWADLFPQAAGKLDAWTDLEQLEESAVSAFAWCAGTRVMTGNGQGRMDPHGFVTRAQYAAVLMRLSWLADHTASGLEDGSQIGASLSVTADGDHLKLLFRNDGEKVYSLTGFTILAAAGQDTWVPLLMEHGYTRPAILRTVQAGSTSEQGFAWKDVYGSLPAGEYRFVQEIGQEDSVYEISGSFRLP